MAGLNTLFLTHLGDAICLINTSGEQTLQNVPRIVAGDGNDLIYLSHPTIVLGDMFIDGGRGDDIIWANSGRETIRGFDGDDILVGGPGDDVLMGGPGADRIFGGDGNDIIVTGWTDLTDPANPVFLDDFPLADGEVDYVDCGDGFDIVYADLDGLNDDDDIIADNCEIVNGVRRNQAPTADAGGLYSGTEGTAILLSLSGSDPNGDALTFTWDLGDGSLESEAATATVTVANANPAVDATTISVDGVPLVGPVPVNTSVDVSASFSDRGAADTHTATIDWGDGSTADATGIVTGSNGSGSVSGSHVYAAAGVYTITITLSDDDGATDQSSYQYVVVYDPDGGFVTGGGWFTSPSAACPNFCGGATGKAHFGFVSKWAPGRSTPQGNTEFRFQAGGLRFKSDTYEMLVVSGNRAQYWGMGAVNGVSGYRFRLTAVDGQVTGNDGTVDKFRIEIKGPGGGLIYDNQWNAAQDAQLTTAIEGGTISIKK